LCGIAGVVKFGDKPILEEQISLCLTGNEHRGNDATGLAIADEDGSVFVFKKALPAWQFVTDIEYYAFIEAHLKPTSWAVILHARAASQGKPEKNENNHPMWDGKSAVVHNGCLRNDESLFKSLKLKRSAETDSDIIRAIIDDSDSFEASMKGLNKIDGGCAAAVVDTRFPKRLMLLRSGNPMVLGSTTDHFFFSSEKATLHRAIKPWVKRYGIFFQIQKPDTAYAPFPDHTAWIIGANGQESHHKFETSRGSYNEPIRSTYTKHYNKKVEAKNDKAVWCDPCKKTWYIPSDKPAHEYTCNKKEGGCGKMLWEMPSGMNVKRYQGGLE
jgi:predicted glutamine amidotransferase